MAVEVNIKWLFTQKYATIQIDLFILILSMFVV